jgi:hypothetical protein
MKSFVAYPLEFEKMLFPQAANAGNSGKVVAHYELYKKVRHLNGSVIKCGISAEEGFTRFAIFRSLMNSQREQKMIAFEKYPQEKYRDAELEDNESVQYQVSSSSRLIDRMQQVLIQKGISENVDFVPGDVHDSIPNYLIENPELKIAFLNIDLDNYESTLTTLEYLYPRLVEGGVLVLDNYFKNEEEHKAIETYFSHAKVVINNFSVSKGPHYVIK